jgi:hypothetical protein
VAADGGEVFLDYALFAVRRSLTNANRSFPPAAAKASGEQRTTDSEQRFFATRSLL